MRNWRKVKPDVVPNRKSGSSAPNSSSLLAEPGWSRAGSVLLSRFKQLFLIKPLGQSSHKHRMKCSWNTTDGQTQDRRAFCLWRALFISAASGTCCTPVRKRRHSWVWTHPWTFHSTSHSLSATQDRSRCCQRGTSVIKVRKQALDFITKTMQALFKTTLGVYLSSLYHRHYIYKGQMLKMWLCMRKKRQITKEVNAQRTEDGIKKNQVSFKFK